ncbi:hypothetical protein [Aureimonas populi]|uniref:ATPase n=1 Tax=Aureimonas populi TaxID=1701758 RepID=A0ABW5CJH4_9HYPH|nr:hypothetical protein [Aureimonas populi]
MSAPFDEQSLVNLLRGTQEGVREEPARPEAAPNRAPAEPEQPAAPLPDERDFSAALDLVKRACHSLRGAEARAVQMEREMQRLREAAAGQAEEIEALTEHVAALQARADEAEQRAEEAQNRAAEAEGWLVRLHDAIKDGFSPARRPAPAGDEEQEGGAGRL